MTAWAAFFDYVLPEVPGVSQEVAEHHIRLAAIEFCRDTGIYVHRLPAINVVASTAAYTLTSDVAQHEVAFVRAAWYDTTRLDEGPRDALNDMSSTNWTTVAADTPRAYTQTVREQITLHPTPSASLTGGLVVEVALMPTLTATSLADWVADEYMEGIASGAKARLMAMPQVPWASPDHSGYHRTLFNAAKADARIEVNRSLMRSKLMVRQRPAA